MVTDTVSSDHVYGAPTKRGTDWSHLSGRYRVLPTGVVPSPKVEAPPSLKRPVKSGHPALKSNPSGKNEAFKFNVTIAANSVRSKAILPDTN